VLYALSGTPLVAPDHPHETLEALLAAMLGEPLLANGGKPWFAALDDIAEGGPVAAALNDVFNYWTPAEILIERLPRAILRRRPKMSYVDKTLSSKRRRELRRQRRKLSEVLGEEPVVVDRAGEDVVYGEFVKLEAAGRKGTRGTVLAADPRHVRFFLAVCRNYAREGRLQFLALQGAGQPLALQCNLLAGSTIFRMKIAYDERWAAYSPGIQLELEGIRVFHEETEALLMDSCAAANNAMINRLWPDRMTVATFALPQRGPRALLAAPALRMTRSARRWNRRRRR
jgi:hypothetical protein